LGFDLVRAARDAVERHERVRTLYVAMTRAKRRLVVSGHWSQDATRGVHGGLLAHSRGAAQAEARARLAADGDGTVDGDGVRWIFLARARPPAERPLRPAATGAVDVARARADAAHLAAARAEAARRAARPLAAAVTAARLHEGAAERAEG